MNYIANSSQDISIAPRNAAVSVAAESVADRLDSISSSQGASCSRNCLQRESIYTLLADLFKECSYKGWDGYQAEPLSEASKVRAADFIRNLPDEYLTTEFDVTPDGKIALFWKSVRGSDKLLTLVIDGQLLYYAAKIGHRKAKNKLPYNFSIPTEILNFISQVVGSAR